MPMAVTIVLCLVNLLIGFILGTRGRQIVASAKMLGQVAKSFSLKIPGQSTVLGQDTSSKDDGEQEQQEVDDQEIGLEDFLAQGDADLALADHPDVVINSVMMYKLKKAKEEQRSAQRRAALLAEGFDENEVAERMELEESTGGGGGGRMNALALLISVGARVEAAAGGDSADAQKLQERRRLQRNVEIFLNKTEGVEKFKSDKKYEHRDPTGRRYKSAYEVARETLIHHAGGDAYKREIATIKTAKDARILYRRFKARNPQFFVRRRRPSGDSDQPQSKGLSRMRSVGGSVALDAAAIASLQAELDDEDEDEVEGKDDDGADASDDDEADDYDEGDDDDGDRQK